LAETIRNLLLVKIGADDALLGTLKEERKNLDAIASLVGQETLEASFQCLSQTVAEIARSPFPRAVLELAILRLPQFTQLRNVTEVLARLSQGGHLVPAPLAASPSKSPAEKRPQAVAAVAPHAPPALASSPTSIDWKGFVAFTMSAKPSIGTLLEHAIALNSAENWKAESLIRIGFRDNQKFYHDQAKSSLVLGQIEALAAKFLGQSAAKVLVEMVEPAPEVQTLKSIGQTKAEGRKEKIEAMKQNFLRHDLTKDTREIFGAELTAFDIKEDSGKKENSHE
jgi:DNA polymerase-3 subunit gamma/tau